MLSALKASKTQDNIVIACDTPELNKSVYEKLLNRSQDYDAVIAGTSENYIEPLIAYYKKRVMNSLEKRILEKKYKLQNALEDINTKVEIFKEKDLFKNNNYPSDLL